jgi:hypothetical protein
MPADDDLAAAVARLPAAQREVVSLKIDGGLTFAEIAAVIGTSINTAASRYRYAIENIRTTIMLFHNQVEKVYDLAYVRLQQIDIDNEPEGIIESLINWNNEWNIVSPDERISE